MTVLARRLRSQLLSGPPARAAVSVAERLLAVQAQDPRGARLAVRARPAGGRAADVDRALTEDRSLVVSWLNRGTLHLVCSEDYPWLHQLTTPQLFVGNARRLAQEGVPPAAADRGVDAVVQALATDGPLVRAQLRERVAAAGVPTQGQALVHVLMLASLRGLVVRGPVVGREQAFVLVSDWLPPGRALGREQALTELARRYLTGHGPAGAADLARWAGVPLRDARTGFGAVAAELSRSPDGLWDLADRPASPPACPPPRLLGAFEPVLLGWTSRSDITGDNQDLVTDNGIFRPFAMVEGRAVATWAMPRGEVVLSRFHRLDASTEDALAAEAMAVKQFLAD
ncbi:MAG: winged helix DNA-binding domain-containing protein [Actinomycetota bacterium]|nr:winged helix DNA-binding domain-containing protein [Actinomycetota bacterium]